MLDPNSIDQQRTCKVRLIAQDLSKWVEESKVYESLLRRGVFKWWAVRRKLIKLRWMMRRWIAESEDYKKHWRKHGQEHLYWHEKGYQRALIEMQDRLKRLIISERLQHDPKDREAYEYMNFLLYGPRKVLKDIHETEELVQLDEWSNEGGISSATNLMS